MFLKIKKTLKKCKKRWTEDVNIAVLDRQDGPVVDPCDWSTDALKEKMLEKEDHDDLRDTFLEDVTELGLDVERKNALIRSRFNILISFSISLQNLLANKCSNQTTSSKSDA